MSHFRTQPAFYVVRKLYAAGNQGSSHCKFDSKGGSDLAQARVFVSCVAIRNHGHNQYAFAFTFHFQFYVAVLSAQTCLKETSFQQCRLLDRTHSAFPSS